MPALNIHVWYYLPVFQRSLCTNPSASSIAPVICRGFHPPPAVSPRPETSRFWEASWQALWPQETRPSSRNNFKRDSCKTTSELKYKIPCLASSLKKKIKNHCQSSLLGQKIQYYFQFQSVYMLNMHCTCTHPLSEHSGLVPPPLPKSQLCSDWSALPSLSRHRPLSLHVFCSFTVLGCGYRANYTLTAFIHITLVTSQPYFIQIKSVCSFLCI